MSATDTRSGFKSPWRRRKAALSFREWLSLFTPEGRLQYGGMKLLEKVRSRGIEPSIMGIEDLKYYVKLGIWSRFVRLCHHLTD
ncbi:hypothetical protein GUJ93_ZPchr0011g27952 [Zizania palustris]|uniref:Uncharacterized protein n=1 Tax=Zizania palustris TaxID=103762 RepID=A0A8J5WLZ0_ZIZPA|nr:hypothetical protein GUJ93_ZPchr0011g27952 [Zizania palustris]